MRDLQDKVVYQVYPKSFQDTDDDGIGDLNGITRRLDHIRELGADYLWITPFFPSPQRDNGYDVADYCAVDPRFGTMADLEKLIAEADKRGIGLMLDMVFNHTSTEHAWFQKALAGDETYQDYYIFKAGDPDTPPTNWVSKFGGNAWEYVPSLKKWYLHLFDVTQADLNWENPAVREELKQVIRFWKEKGIRGFRFDVINLISKPEVFENDYEGDGRRFYTDGRHVHEFLKELVRDTGIGDMITVGELSSTTLEQAVRYANPAQRELSMCFGFHHLKVDYVNGDKWKIQPADLGELKVIFSRWQERMQQAGSWNSLFWSNHDQPRVVSRFGDEGRYWKESAKMLATAQYMMRGTPYVYQGEELGMTNAHFTSIDQYVDVESRNYYKIMRAQGLSDEDALAVLATRSRDNGRTPVWWTEEENVGFSQATPWVGVAEHPRGRSAQVQRQQADSIYRYYQQLFRLRKERRVIAEGEIRFHPQTADPVLVYERRWQDQRLVVACNFSAEPQPVALPEGYAPGHCLLGNYEDANLLTDGRTLRPYEAVILE